jgi:hypothetical protein
MKNATRADGLARNSPDVREMGKRPARFKGCGKKNKIRTNQSLEQETAATKLHSPHSAAAKTKTADRTARRLASNLFRNRHRAADDSFKIVRALYLFVLSRRIRAKPHTLLRTPL